MIDTNIVIHAGDGLDAVPDKLAEHDGAVLLSGLSLAELQRGLYKNAAHTALRRARMDILPRTIPILPFDADAAACGQIMAPCGRAEERDYDRMIAAHAIASTSMPVTGNEVDFRDIHGLIWENWSS